MKNRLLTDSRGHCCRADFELPGHLQVFLAQHEQEQNEQADEQDAEDSQSRDGSNAWIHLFGCRYTDRQTHRQMLLPLSTVLSDFISFPNTELFLYGTFTLKFFY